MHCIHMCTRMRGAIEAKRMRGAIEAKKDEGCHIEAKILDT